MAEINNAAARPLINPIINECFSVMTTNAAAESATAEPTDMSICRATKSKVIGQAITPTTDALTMMLVKFSAPKKYGVVKEKMITIAIKTRSRA
jgi:hypothetical protein